MITTCTVCQTRYQLDAAKVPPRRVRVRCPDCHGVFELDGTLAAVTDTAPVAGLDNGRTAPPAAATTEPMAVPAVDRTQVEPTAAPAESPLVDAPVESPLATAPAESPLADAPVESPLAAAPDPVPEPAPVVEAAAVPVAQPAADLAQEVETVAASASTATLELEEAPEADEGTARRRRSKEEMLARALVSDILVYNRELRDTALAEGNLLEALGGEIKKSWELYKEKVTPEVANSTNHFRDALNEILAAGGNVF